MSSAFAKINTNNRKTGHAARISSKASVDNVHKECGGTAAHHKHRKQDGKYPDYCLLRSVTQNGILPLP